MIPDTSTIEKIILQAIMRKWHTAKSKHENTHVVSAVIAADVMSVLGQGVEGMPASAGTRAWSEATQAAVKEALKIAYRDERTAPVVWDAVEQALELIRQEEERDKKGNAA